jgi:hypothetical protein
MKKMPKRKEDKTEQIELLRGGFVVSSLTGAFGKKVRETRLTAILGYLMALEPKPFLEKFGFEGTASSISLESKEENTRNEENIRSDIRVKTTKGIGIIEAKLGWQNPYKQLIKYKADWRVALTQYRPSEQEKKRKVLYICWEDIGKMLIKFSKSKLSKWETKFISRDILEYLESNNMIKSQETTEIYTRDFNEPSSLNLFLKARLFSENYKKNSQLYKALYFAPNFCEKICNDPQDCGISYIAKIKGAVELVDSWGQFVSAVKYRHGEGWLKRNKSLISHMRNRQYWEKKKRCLLFLGKPRLVFYPPVKKSKVTGRKKGKDNKRFLSFDELFSAWEGGKLKTTDNE